MKHALVVVALTVAALAAAATPSAAHKKSKPTPLPVPRMQSNAPKGYYLMQGNRILSAAFPNVSACYNNLAALKKKMIPGTDTVVCVHRQP